MPGTDGIEAAVAALASASAKVRDSLERVWDGSDFVARSVSRDSTLIPRLIAQQDFERSLSSGDFAARAPQVPSTSTGAEAEWMGELRCWRRREFVRIAWRDLANWAPLSETLADLSAVADAAIGAACEFAMRTLVARHGVPRSQALEAQPLIVVGMGKLGGGELNFSSDIDLIFLFPEHGETDGPRPMANEEFFTRVGQMLVRLLDAPTADGFVFRVDLRLRPFGASGPLVASFASFEDYLLRHGRDWERYAYVKARAITGLKQYAQIFASAVRPFVYRRYLDYGVFESLREMKTLIEREVEKRELADDVKLGPGGIREIEFIVQAFSSFAADAIGTCKHRCSRTPCRGWMVQSSCQARWSLILTLPIPICAASRIGCRCSRMSRLIACRRRIARAHALLMQWVLLIGRRSSTSSTGTGAG